MGGRPGPSAGARLEKIPEDLQKTACRNVNAAVNLIEGKEKKVDIINLYLKKLGKKLK